MSQSTTVGVRWAAVMIVGNTGFVRPFPAPTT
jgi:hypothetical protein